MVKLKDPAIPLLSKVVKRALLTPSFFNVLVFGTDNLVYLIKKSSISNNFEQELVRSCNLPIRKRRAKGAPASTNFCLSFDNF